MIPGRALHRIADALIPADTRALIIDAQLADFQHEWRVARSTKARMVVLLRGYGAFWQALPACALRGLRKDTLQPVFQATSMLVGVELMAALIAAAVS